MTNPHCRIGKVRPKAAPHLAEIVIEPRTVVTRDQMHEEVDWLYEWAGRDGVAAVALVGFDFKGHYIRAMYIHRDACFGKTMFPSMVAEVLRREISRDIAVGVLQGEE